MNVAANASLSLSKEKIRFLLLEGIQQAAVCALQEHGYSNVELLPDAMSGRALEKALRGVHFLGIRSGTRIDARLLEAAPRLNAIGCYCIGTNQVDLTAAERLGIPVFNAPFSNTRSVAELVLAEIVFLMRGIAEKNALAHRGVWAKTAEDAHEIRGKRLGIVGYGHIGTQLGVLAESLGMDVCYFDIQHKLPLGNARAVPSLEELLKRADVVSLHVPETPDTADMIAAQELALMRPGGLLINASRGTVVDAQALADALRSRHLRGAAVDVFPQEPSTTDETFSSPLTEFDNVILTPHVGGSTQEAQHNIALEVTSKLVKYSDNGSTATAVNFPQVTLPDHYDKRRLLHIHRNVPGVLERINRVFSENGVNIAAQYLQTSTNIGYVVMDVELADATPLLSALRDIPGTIRARLLH